MLTVENLYQSYGDKVLFNNVSCTIKERDRIGLIGVNGTGKSTFLKMIAGRESPESGSIHHARDYQVVYLAQEPDLNEKLNVMQQIYYGDSHIMQVLRQYDQALAQLEENLTSQQAQRHLAEMQQKMDEQDAWNARTTAQTILSKLGITDFSKRVGDLSGGEERRVALAQALMQPADLLILDEPTNHLDNETIEWLEVFLTTYPGALLLVTHDRYFLNRVTQAIFELDEGNLYQYEGNYELFLEKKAEREELEKKNELKHANTLRNELAWLKRGARARSTKQKARIERIEQMQDETFHTNDEQIAFQAGSQRLGKQVIELEHIGKAYDKKMLIRNFSHLFTQNNRVGIVGPNGSGKTTLLNIMAGRITPDAGEVTIGDTVKIGYYTQTAEELDGDLRVIDAIKETAEVITTKHGEIITAEQMLERFLFTRPEQWTYIRRLSGGEKRRLYLLKVLMTEPNVLFLDEPTNDLDTQTLGVLEDYLDHFPGVVMTVSHDRYFLDRVVDQLLVFSEDGQIDLYEGNYSMYLADKEKSTTIAHPSRQVKTNQIQKSNSSSMRKRLSYRDKKEWNVIEDEIMELEQELEEIKARIEAAGSDIDKVQDLYLEQQALEKEINAKMDRWEELSLLVEQIEAEKNE